MVEAKRKSIELGGTRGYQATEAYNMFFMSEDQRRELGNFLGIEGIRVPIDYRNIPKIISDAQDATREKVEGIGLTIPQYHGAWEAFRDQNLEGIRELKGISRRKMDEARERWISTKDQHKDPTTGRYRVDRLYFHHQLVQEKLLSLVPEQEPVFMILVGTPGAGKTALRTEEMGSSVVGRDDIKFSNYAVTDPDALRADVMPGFDATNAQHVYETQEEVFDLSTEIMEEALRRGLNIVCETTLRNTEWVLDTLKIAKGYKSKMILIHTPLEECFRRTVAWRARAASIDFLLSAMGGYDNFFTLSERDEVDQAIVLETDPNQARTKIYEKGKGTLAVANEERVAAIRDYGRAFKQVSLYE